METTQVLTAEQPEFRIDGLDVPAGLTSPDSTENLVFDASIRIELDEIPEVSEPEESVISVSLNDRAMVQLRLVVSEGTATLHGGGWVDLSPDIEVVPGVPLELTFANYAAQGSSDASTDHLTFRLAASGGVAPHLSVSVLPDSQFQLDINPVDLVVLEILPIEERSSPDQLEIRYEVRSPRAETAIISLEEPVGLEAAFSNFDDAGTSSSELTLLDGVATGMLVVGVIHEAESIEGSVLARTAFNSPSERFFLTVEPAGQRLNWPVVGVLALVVLSYATYRFRRSHDPEPDPQTQ